MRHSLGDDNEFFWGLFWSVTNFFYHWFTLQMNFIIHRFALKPTTQKVKPWMAAWLA
jgi:hypothetical protein